MWPILLFCHFGKHWAPSDVVVVVVIRQENKPVLVRAARLPPYLMLALSGKAGLGPTVAVEYPVVGLDVAVLCPPRALPDPVLYDLVAAIHRSGTADGRAGALQPCFLVELFGLMATVPILSTCMFVGQHTGHNVAHVRHTHAGLPVWVKFNDAGVTVSDVYINQNPAAARSTE